MNWMLDILITHRRLRGLTEAQLWELIDISDDIETLRAIKEHLEQNSFRYPHIKAQAPKMVSRCVEKAKLILWKQSEVEVRKAFLERVDPFAK